MGFLPTHVLGGFVAVAASDEGAGSDLIAGEAAHAGVAVVDHQRIRLDVAAEGGSPSAGNYNKSGGSYFPKTK